MALHLDDIPASPTPASSALPRGWRIVRFDQMAENVTDRVDKPSESVVEYYVGLEHLDPESLKIRRWGTPNEVEATKLRFKPGDIIFGRRRAYQRKLAVADFEGICSAHAMVLRAHEDTVLKDFLPFFMQSDLFFDRALQISVGSLSPTINWSVLARQEFAIPPMDEQRRIADILWAADASKRAYDHCLDQAEQTRRVVLASLVMKGIDHDDFKQSDAGLIPCTWTCARVGDVGEVRMGRQRAPKYAKGTNMRPYLRVANVFDGYLDLNDVLSMDFDERDCARYVLQPGDILLNEGQSRELVGRSCIYRGEVEG